MSLGDYDSQAIEHLIKRVEIAYTSEFSLSSSVACNAKSLLVFCLVRIIRLLLVSIMMILWATGPSL